MITKKVIFHAYYSDIEKLAEETFGFKDYNFAEVQECNNDTSHEFDVGPVGDFDKKHNSDAIKDIKNGTRVKSYRNGLLLDLLHEAGKLEAGHYVVRVSW